MGEKEKLVQLLLRANDAAFELCASTTCATCEAKGSNCKEVLVAELLLEYGVTAQQWVPVEERPPDLIPCNAGTAYSEAVLVWTDGKKAMVAVWDGVDFLCAADYWEAWGETITHWMPLPKLPKGENDNG